MMKFHTVLLSFAHKGQINCLLIFKSFFLSVIPVNNVKVDHAYSLCTEIKDSAFDKYKPNALNKASFVKCHKVVSIKM